MDWGHPLCGRGRHAAFRYEEFSMAFGSGLVGVDDFLREISDPDGALEVLNPADATLVARVRSFSADGVARHIATMNDALAELAIRKREGALNTSQGAGTIWSWQTQRTWRDWSRWNAVSRWPKRVARWRMPLRSSSGSLKKQNALTERSFPRQFQARTCSRFASLLVWRRRLRLGISRSR